MKSRPLAACVAVLFTMDAALSVAVAQDFTIDTNLSSMTISGIVVGSPLTNQAAGSLTTHVSGTIRATVAANGIQFTGQSLLVALNSGSWQPLADGTTGSAPANYGGLVSTALGNGLAALRNIELDVTSPVISVSNGQFDSSSLTFLFPSNAPSSLAYTVSGLFSTHGVRALTGYSTNRVTALATLATVGSQQTLTIPVNASYQFKLISANDTTITLQGQLVAVRSAESGLEVQSLAVLSGMVTMQWQAAPGQEFQIQSSADLSSWQTNAVNVTSLTGNYTWSGPAVGSIQFFRLAQ